MKKFYCFTAGQLVPSWVVDFVSHDRESEFNNKNAKIVFSSSCIGIKEDDGHVKLLRLNDKNDDQNHFYIKIDDMVNADVGGVGKGRGIHISSRSHQKDFGKGLHYSHSIVNGKEVLTQLKGSDDVSIQGSK
ncbi:hypothetical protein PS2_0070 [Aeromonas phage PS2]|uniref:Uncharacterized protein n=1 Tax=Aeromonas phage PS1 TaxID=2591406 RepID=A0A514TUX6_9CAUD|nr:hypothetical protein PQC64_gp191 [Aeromonas phage PS1]QDJ96831.1 hypothetical protein PS1_0072 [Aeromonas phage PS1]QFR59461.1 hypothetical protein PS2_0070 [Aeromonas phage PS2]